MQQAMLQDFALKSHIDFTCICHYTLSYIANKEEASFFLYMQITNKQVECYSSSTLSWAKELQRGVCVHGLAS